MWKFIKGFVLWGFVAAMVAFGVQLMHQVSTSGLQAELPKPLADCSLQGERVKLVTELQHKRVIHTIERQSILPHVYITLRFRLLNVDTKTSFLGMISAHEWCAGRGDHLVLRDSQNGKRVGQFTAAFGLSLD